MRIASVSGKFAFISLADHDPGLDDLGKKFVIVVRMLATMTTTYTTASIRLSFCITITIKT